MIFFSFFILPFQLKPASCFLSVCPSCSHARRIKYTKIIHKYILLQKLYIHLYFTWLHSIFPSLFLSFFFSPSSSCKSHFIYLFLYVQRYLTRVSMSTQVQICQDNLPLSLFLTFPFLPPNPPLCSD